jgi:hypothetical protein
MTMWKLLVASALLLLAGCGDDEKPVVVPSDVPTVVAPVPGESCSPEGSETRSARGQDMKCLRGKNSERGLWRTTWPGQTPAVSPTSR